jgi:acetamidase/formamidase/AraC-like DNA-binding protein
MSVRRFTSESYPAGERRAAWQDLVGALGLRADIPASTWDAHAIGSLRGEPDGITVVRLVAGRQALIAMPRRTGAPLIFVPQDASASLDLGGERRRVAAGRVALLPRPGEGRLLFEGDCRTLVLSAGEDAFRGRRIDSLDAPLILPPKGLAGVLAGSLAAAAEGFEALTDAEWEAVAAGLAEMLLALLRSAAASSHEAGSASAAQAALLHRLHQSIERHLDDPEFTPARAAEANGISERYLHRLFETTGESFAQTLRNRRLLRCRQNLADPAEAHQTVSEIAFRCGFTDAAHFSRAFRERFGLSPRAYRQAEAARARATVRTLNVQRGWPKDAPVRVRRPEPRRVASPIPSLAEGAASPRHHHLPVTAANVHWGFFSRTLKPVLEITSGDTVTVETLSQHASDDPALMIAGDPGAEEVFRWTPNGKAVDRRGAGPMDASVYGRGAGEGFGVHICTGPIAVRGAEPGDVLEVRILDMAPRLSQGRGVAGRAFGSSAATWWGFHYGELLSEPKPREVVTIFEIEAGAIEPHARALYSFRWAPQTDPFGVVHRTYDYPGVLVAPDSVARRHGVLDGIRVPLRPHFGVIGLAPRESDLVDSIPPSYFGGNLDNWRLGKGASVYLPVSVPGALLSIGDPHAAQGDGELSGTAIECSMTGTVEIMLHKRVDLAGGPFADLTYPLIETPTEWVLTGFSHPDYLAEFGAKGQSAVYATSSVDLAMKDAFRKARRFLMQGAGLDEDEAVALISAAVDFGVTQVVDGNWGVHAIVSKRLLPAISPTPP